MKTTFSYFSGMFENPGPAKYYFKKTKSTDRSKISSDQKRLFFAVSLYTPFNFSRTLPLRKGSLKSLLNEFGPKNKTQF